MLLLYWFTTLLQQFPEYRRGRAFHYPAGCLRERVVRGDWKHQFVRMQQLAVHSPSGIRLIRTGIAVLGISYDRVPQCRQMGADLVRLSGEKLYFEQCYAVGCMYGPGISASL